MTWRSLRLVSACLLLVAIFFTQIAASDQSVKIATTLAGAAVILSPLGIGLLKPVLAKLGILDGPKMLALTYAVAFVIAAAALLLGGDARVDPSSAGSVLAFATALWGVQQLVYGILKDHSTVGPIVN